VDERSCASICANDESITNVAADAISQDDLRISYPEPAFSTSAVSETNTVSKIITIHSAALVAGKAMQRKTVALYVDVFSEFCLLKPWCLRRDTSFDEVFA